MTPLSHAGATGSPTYRLVWRWASTVFRTELMQPVKIADWRALPDWSPAAALVAGVEFVIRLGLPHEGPALVYVTSDVDLVQAC